MIRNFLLTVTLLCNIVLHSQIVINEIDPDTNSTDVKEFIELKSSVPNFSLSGFVIVFFNAGSTAPYSGTSSYYAVDLDGFFTDSNGNILIGNLQVSPSASYIIPQNTIQNGPDAIAIYYGNASDFPIYTPASAINLIDALVYSNSASTAATALMTILGETVSYNENINGLASTQSIQRKLDGTYEVKTPTPRANNDGSGFVFNGIAVTYTSNSITEGQNFIIIFTTDTPVLSALNFSINLNNGSFNSADYSGNLNISIPIGATSTSTTISILNDGANEGDENMQITVGIVPSEFVVLNNNISIRVNDLNFSIRPWGSPVNPTRGLCASTVPLGYYSSLEGKSGLILKQAVSDIISDSNIVRVQNYGDVYSVLKDADQNPQNSGQVWMLYDELPISKIDIQTDNSTIGKWNREHIYSQSRLGIPSIFIPVSIPDGINIYRLTTGLSDIEASHDDMHHLRAVGGQENSSRSNRNFGVDYNGPTGTLGSWRGDVARAIFYMALRYDGLNVENGNPSVTPTGRIGDLATLLSWNVSDASDDFEMNRNNIIYTWQMNRNPFIDYPLLADYIWGSRSGQSWSSALSTENFNDLKAMIYPNPAQNYLNVLGLDDDATLEIYTLSGMKIKTENFVGPTQLNLDLPSGIYYVKIATETKSITKKLIIN